VKKNRQEIETIKVLN